MSSVPLMLVLTAIVLGYISVLIFIRLTGSGVTTRRVRAFLIELWSAFILIILVFWASSRLVGPVEQGGSVFEELSAMVRQWGALSPLQLVLLVGGLLIAVLLFVHVMYSLNAAQKSAPGVGPADNGEIDQ